MKIMSFFIRFVMKIHLLSIPLITNAETSFKCLKLENISIGCVPSTDHSCFMNRLVDKSGECTFGRGWDHTYRVEGPISWHCQTSTSTTICDPPSNTTDGSNVNCHTVSNCSVWAPPSCREECTGCYTHRITALIGRAIGCMVCTRSYCPDEPPVQLTCPNSYNGLPHVSGVYPECTVPSHCPSTAVDPNGVSHPVTIIKGNCPPEPPPLPPGVSGKYCPWLVDERSKTGCEPIRPENKNPKAL